MGGSSVAEPLLLRTADRTVSFSSEGAEKADAHAAVFPSRPARPTRASLEAQKKFGAPGMKQRDLRTHIIREWDTWLQGQAIQPGTATGRDSLKFYFELQDKRSTLLNFQSRGRDKWQIVHSWLLSEHRVND